MLTLLLDNLGTILTGAVVLGVVIAVIVSLKRKPPGCPGGCPGCAASGGCPRKPQ